MVKKNNNTLEQIYKNLTSFYKKIKNKNLNINFWVIADRSDFKPLKKITTIKKKETKTNIHSISEINEHILDDKAEFYKNKKFAEIIINVDEDILSKTNIISEYKNIKDKPILYVHIIIYLLDNEGHLNFLNKWELKVNYVVDDFRTLNFKLKNVEVLMRLVSDSVVVTNSINGISYKNLLIKIEKNKADK